MIKFQRRNIGCWEICDDVDRNRQHIPVLEFETETALLEYVAEVLPWTTTDPNYKLRIKDDVVVQWTVLGFILPTE